MVAIANKYALTIGVGFHLNLKIYVVNLAGGEGNAYDEFVIIVNNRQQNYC